MISSAMTTIMFSEKDPVKASEEPQDPGMNLDYNWVWNQTIAFGRVIYDAEYPGDIKKGREWATAGEEYTIDQILEPTMKGLDNPCGLSEYKKLPIGYIDQDPFKTRKYSSKIDITDYSLTIHKDGEDPENIPISELFPLGVGFHNLLRWPTDAGFDRTFEIEDANIEWIDIQNLENSGDYKTVPCTLLNEYDTFIGPVVYLDTNDPVPENHDCIFILNEEPESEEKLDNLSDALGCILIEDSSKGWNFTNGSQYSVTIGEVNESESNFSSVIEEIQSGSIYIAENIQDSETVVFTNCSDQPCCSGPNYVVIFSLDKETDFGTFAFFKNLIKKSYCLKCKGAIMVNYAANHDENQEHPHAYGDTHMMAHTVHDWSWFSAPHVWESYYLNRFPLPIFSVSHNLGWQLIEDLSSYHVDYGHLTQEFKKQTLLNPIAVPSHNVVAYRNISQSPGDAIVVLSNRMDSWWGECPGDASTSGAILLGIAKYMKDNDITPKYDLTFLFTTGEEYGMRGAQHYVDSHPIDEYNYKYWIGFEQLGFQYPLNEEHNLSLSTYNTDLYPYLCAIQNQTNYEERMNSSYFKYRNLEAKTGWDGAEDYVWEGICDTILIEKDDNWSGHHQVGDDYQEGDSLKYINRTDVNVTFELAWNMTKYFCINPDCSFDEEVSYTIFDSPNDGDTLPDTVRAEFSINSILPSDRVMVNATLRDQNDNGAVVAWKVVNYTITTLSQSHPYNITITIPDTDAQGEYTLQLRLYNSTGRINISVDPGDDEPNEIQESYSFNLYHPFGNPTPGDSYSNTEDVIRGSYFTANEYGTARNITAYVQCGNVSGPPSIHSVCMIYRKSDNKLIGRTEDTNPVTGASPDWVVYNFTEPYPVLEEDTEYVLVCWSEAPCYLYYDHVVLMSRGRYNDTTYGVPPDPIVWDGANNNLYSIYCGYRNESNPPWVTNISEDPHIVGFGGNVTISADVVDNESGVNTVTVNIGYPGGKAENKTMTLVSGDTYQYVFNNTWLVGQYNYSIWAVDNYNNSINRSVRSHFHVSAEASISIATLQDSYSGNQYINITDPPNPLENYSLIDQGQTWNKYYNATTGQNVLEVSAGPINYQEEGTWTPINNTLNQLAENHPAYVYGYRSGNNRGLYGAYFKSNAQLDWPVAFTYNKSNDPTIHAVRSKLVGVGYVDPQSNWAYQYLQNVQNGQGQTNGYSITYPGVFTGTDVTWSYGNTGLKEEITMSNATKTVLQNHPPSQYGLNDASSYLVFITRIDYQNLNIYNSSGVLAGNVTISDTGVEFKDALGQFKCALPLGEAYELNNQSARQKLTYRIVHLNGNTYLLSGLKVTDLNAMTFPVVVDPTLSVNSLFNDGYIYNSSTRYSTVWEARSGTVDGSSTYLSIGQKKAGFPTSTYYIYRGFVLFNTTALTSNAYIDSAILSLYKKDDYSTTDFDITIQNGQPTYPHNPLAKDDYDKGLYSGNGGSMNTTSFVSGRNNISISEFDWINEAGISKFCLRSSRDISGTTPTGSEYVNVYSANAPNSAWVPKLIITYRNQSKIKNTGDTDIQGYLLIQVQFYNSTQGTWLVDNDTINETTPRTITSGNQLALDTIFNGHIRASDLTHGTGTYRVYAAFRDPEGNILRTDDDTELAAWWQFSKT